MADMMRLVGLSSGMDVDSMVTKLMTAHRMPLDKMKQERQQLEWQRDDYRTVYSKVLELRNKSFDMKLSSAYQTNKSTVNNDAVVAASATNAATEGVYSIKVTQLAAAAALTTNDVTTGSGNDTAALSGIGLAANTTLTIGGEKGYATINVKTSDSISDLVKSINNKSGVTGVKASYDKTLDRFFFVSATTGSTSKVDLRSPSADLLPNVFKFGSVSDVTAAGGVANTVTGTQAFASGVGTYVDSTLTADQTFRIAHTVGGTTSNYDFKITKSTSVGQLVDAINSSELGKKGVSAYLDSNNKLAFFNPESANTLAFSDQTSDSKNMVSALGLSAPVTSAGFDYKKVSGTGQDATVKFNGVTGNYSSNTFSIAGINFTAKKVQAADDTTDPPVQVNVTRDVDAIFTNIKGFVDKYNEFLDSVNKKLTEERFRSYKPLTDEQKKEMSEDQIKKWEDKAKSGLVRNDSTIASGMNKMRNTFSSAVEGLPSGDLKHLDEIGISATAMMGSSVSGTFMDRGKLYINEAKLKEAIASRPEEVAKLFTTDDENSTGGTTDGIINRIYERTTELMNQLKMKAGGPMSTTLESYELGKRMKQLDRRSSDMENNLKKIEERYYKQFTQMEQAMNKLNQQSAALAQQMGGSQ